MRENFLFTSVKVVKLIIGTESYMQFQIRTFWMLQVGSSIATKALWPVIIYTENIELNLRLGWQYKMIRCPVKLFPAAKQPVSFVLVNGHR